MDNKKKYIIGIVLFIFLGLMVFTFANPSRNNESGKDNNNGGKTNVEEKDNNKNNQTNNGTNNGNNVVNNQNQVNNQIQNNDNSYDLALEAVKNAEDKIDDESYDNAKDLVDKVTNDNQKNELQERLDKVKDMIDAKKLVEELEKKVNTALDKDEMDNARDFRKTEEIVSKVSNVTNEELKKELEDKLEELAKLLDDVTSPVINIENGAILSSGTNIEVEDENEFSMKLIKNGGAEEEIENGQAVGEGTYTLKVVDKAFNETVIEFIVDLTAPKFNIASGTHSTEDINIEIDDLTLDYVEIYNQDKKTKELVQKNNFVLTDEGTYRLTAYDKAGHKTTVWVAIDKTSPVITGVENGKYYRTDVTATITDKFLVKVLVNDIEQTGFITTGTNNEGRELVLNFKEEGTYTIVAMDKVGNETTVTFTIDKTKPVITGVEDGKYYNTDVTPVISDVNFKNATLKRNGTHIKSYKPGDVITEEGTYTLVATDLAMNKTKLITFVIDKTAPKAVSTTYNPTTPTNGSVEVTIRVNEKILPVEGWTLSEDGMAISRVFEENVNGNVTISDLAGNKVVRYYSIKNIDKEPPKPVSTTYNPTTPTNGSVEVTIRVNEKLLPVEGWTLSEDGMAISRVFEENVNGNVTISDLAGNKVVRYYSIKNIDKEPPKPVSTTYNPTTPTNGSVEVTIRVNEKLLPVEGWTLSEDGMAISRVFEENVNGNVTISDLAGNEVVRYYSIKNIDKNAPVVELFDDRETSLESSAYSIKNVKAVITDENEYTAILTNQNNEEVEYVSGTMITKRGNYTLTVTDKAGNVTTVTFAIDKDYPLVYLNGTKYEKVNNNIVYFNRENGTVTISVKDLNLNVVTLTKDNNEITFTEGMTVTEDGTYVITATDKANNTTKVTFVLDTTAPVVELFDDRGTSLENGAYSIKNVKAVITEANEYTAILTNQNNEEIEYVSGTMITKRGNYTLTVTDKAGNVTTVTFAIDKDYPLVYLNDTKYEKVNNNIVYFNRKNGTVILSVKDLNLNTVTLTKNNNEITFTEGMTITEEGTYVITATDKANNITKVTFIIDKTAPIFKPEKWGYTLEADKNATFTCPTDMTQYAKDELSGLSKVVLDEWYAKNRSIPDQTKPGKFVCRYFSYDKAGNMVSNDIHYTVVDTTAPVITLNGEKNINLVSGVDTYTEEYATVTDNVDETITNLAPAYINYYTLDGTFLGRVSSVDTNNEGRYNLVYYTKDATGNEALKVTRLVYVRLQEDSNKVSIQTAEDLLKISQNPEAYKGKLIVLTNDINLKGINWTPINAWSGVLDGTVIDGQGHSIKNMTVNDETLSAAGFISYNASSVTIKNLVFDNAFVKTKKANQTYAGVVMGKNYVKTTFENITVKNSRVENNWQSGGILGFAETNAQTFKNCTVENTFVGGENATSGSLFGLGDVDVNVINCVAKNVDLYTDGLTWNSTQKKENIFWVGHLYSKTLAVTSSTEENVNIVK